MIGRIASVGATPRRRRRALAAWGLALGVGVSLPAFAHAQRPTGGPPPGGAASARERIAELVRARLGLSDEQARRLEQVSMRYARDRRALVAEEREARRIVRLAAGDGRPGDGRGGDARGRGVPGRDGPPRDGATRDVDAPVGPPPDDATVAAAIDRLLDLQARRLALVRDEQKELAAFLTPTQRARFLGLQERAGQAAQQLRMRRELQRRGGMAERAGPGEPPPA